MIASVITDKDYVDSSDDLSLSNLILKTLKRNEESSANFGPVMWNSVFWNPSWARPDKITSHLNKLLTKDETDDSTFLISDNATFRSGGAGGGLSIPGLIKIGISTKGGTDKKVKVEKSKIMKRLAEKDLHAEWDGEVFKVKPIKLYRLNLSQLNTTSSIATASIQVQRHETVHTIRLRLKEGETLITTCLSTQQLETRMEEKLSKQKSVLEASMEEKLSKQKSVLEEKMVEKLWRQKVEFEVKLRPLLQPELHKHMKAGKMTRNLKKTPFIFISVFILASYQKGLDMIFIPFVIFC